jgi:hypothetical protein
MSKQVVIKIDKNTLKFTLETNGYKGKSCTDIDKILENFNILKNDKKSEYYEHGHDDNVVITN